MINLKTNVENKILEIKDIEKFLTLAKSMILEY
jgi:hypothetical protein